VTGERILLIEDDERIGASLLRALTGSGYDATWQPTGEHGIADARATQPSLVLLDLGLPDLDGLQVCWSIHQHDPTVPIVMLTARDEELDVVVGLDAGAIDYVTKPFKLAELLARVRAQLRQCEPRSLSRTSAGALTIDPAARRAWLAETEIALRPKEFDLLTRLLADAGRVVTRETLMTDVWDVHWFGSTKTLDFHIASLRRKIDAPGRRSQITTLRGVGYRLESA
jgi:DNA-binding response OmpR family regulator